MATSASCEKPRNPETRFNWRDERSDPPGDIAVDGAAPHESPARNIIANCPCWYEADYDITINSDRRFRVTVRITKAPAISGTCHKQTFREAFFGPVAQKFRDDLAKGKFRFLSAFVAVPSAS